MDITNFLNSILLLLVLLNPFLLIVYLIDIVKSKSMYVFTRILIRAGLMSFVAFSAFAILGDSIFSNVFNAQMASFQIFGGVIFLLTGIQFVFKGNASIESLRGESKYVAGAIAMPIFIGPGTISYSVIIGEQLDKPMALLAIACAILLCISIIMLLKVVHDRIQTKKEELIEQYIDIAGRVIAMLLGTVSIELIMSGLDFWLDIL
ncbi:MULTISPECIES: MarC family protein [unclassified Carboxylicivirga]|uniref:MarC family protein n=1 Tax=Carboxylicivirga TaxID=1628153 RepID=UPI003D34FC03